MTERTRRLLDLYTDYLLVSFGQTTATGLATLLPHEVSHDQVTRFLSQNEFTGKDLWKVVKPHVRRVQSEQAVLIFDDTIQEKPCTDQNEIISPIYDGYPHFDHTQNRRIKGVNLLTALYHSQDMSLPVDFSLIQKIEWVTNPKTGKEHWESKQTKNQMLRRMLNDFVRTQTPFRHVLADVWYASAETITFIKQKKAKEFVFPLKNNGKTSVLYLVTSDLTLSDSGVIGLYQRRWSATCGKWQGKSKSSTRASKEHQKSSPTSCGYPPSPNPPPSAGTHRMWVAPRAIISLPVWSVLSS
jgi:hypothetical protein